MHSFTAQPESLSDEKAKLRLQTDSAVVQIVSSTSEREAGTLRHEENGREAERERERERKGKRD